MIHTRDAIKGSNQEIDQRERKTAIIIVTYNRVPNLENLRSCLNYVDYIFIIDNGSKCEVIENLKIFASDCEGRIFLHFNKTNLGLSTTINAAVELFYKYGIYWFYIFDQDAIVDKMLFSETRKIWDQCKAAKWNVGIVVPIVGDQEVLLGQNLKLKRHISRINSAITSGIFTNLDIFKEIGGFDESYFVYGVDIDFTLRVRRKGYEIFRINTIYLIQSFGNPISDDSSQFKLFVKLSKIYSLLNIRLNMVNSYHSIGYGYSQKLLNVQLDTSRQINRKYKRIVAEIYRLGQKYISPLLRKGY